MKISTEWVITILAAVVIGGGIAVIQVNNSQSDLINKLEQRVTALEGGEND